jgi:uracil-DNA glycosylase
LGTFSAHTLLKTDAKITTLRGRFYEFTPLESPIIHGGDDINKTSIPIAESSLRHGKGEDKAPSFLTGFAGIKVFPTYHPAYLLRNPERKREVWEDMKQIAKYMVSSDKPSQPVGENSR